MDINLFLRNKILILVLLFATQASQAQTKLLALEVSANKHFFQTSDGKPFFWLADTAWSLRNLNDNDLELYLSNRQSKGFNVIQIALGIIRPDVFGQLLYSNNNTDTPNLAAWNRMDYIYDRAESYGIYVVNVPLWGSEYTTAFGSDLSKANRLGKWLGSRYKQRNNIMWLTSGEYDSINGYTLPVTSVQKNLLNSFAEGLESGHGGTHLMSIHPGIAYTSSLDFHTSNWLDFNSLQSGHEINREAYGHSENYKLVAADYALSPAKPVLDTEPFYEDHPDGYWITKDVNSPRGAPDVVRRKAYWAIFAGAFGHTYGHNDVYGFFLPGQTQFSLQRNSWKDSIHANGATQMKYLKNLMLSKSFFTRIPDQSILASNSLAGNDHIRATRDTNGSYALIYSATGSSFSINMNKIIGSGVYTSWFDPRTGTQSAPELRQNVGQQSFDPPGNPGLGNDWVLVVESSGSTLSRPHAPTRLRIIE